jgi:hypothetical protein
LHASEAILSGYRGGLLLAGVLSLLNFETAKLAITRRRMVRAIGLRAPACGRLVAPATGDVIRAEL